MGKIATWLGRFLIPYFLERLAVVIKEQYDKRVKRNEDSKKAKESVTPLKDATSGKEIDDASRKALDDF